MENNMQQNPGVPVFEIELLFSACPGAASQDGLQKALAARFGSAEGENGVFQIGKYPVKVCVSQPEPFDASEISDFTRSQMWNVKDAGTLLSYCTHRVKIADEGAQEMHYKERGDLVVQMTEAVLEQYPECVAVYTPSAGRLLTVEQVRRNPARGADRFLFLCVNTRFFSMDGTDQNVLVDTVGLSSVGLPDLQYHFHSLNPSSVMKHAYSVASLLCAVGPMMKSGETIDGMDNHGITQEIRWPFQYQQATVEPPRIVMAITPGDYAVK